MSRPDPRQQAVMSAAFAGAVDLSGLKNRPAPPPAGAPDAADGPAGSAVGGTGSPFVVDVDEASFAQVLQISATVLVVVELNSARVSGGEQLSIPLASLARRGPGAWILARVDVDASPRIAQAFGVRAVPTVVAIAGGQPVDAFEGVLPEPQIREWIDGLLTELRDRLPGIKEAEAQAGEPEPEPADPRFVNAEELLDAGDFAGAEAAYQAVLDVEPANAQAAAALGQVRFLARVTGHPEDAIDQADASPDDVALQSAAADLEVAAGDPAAAFERLVGLVRRTAGDDRDAARDHLVSLFGLFPTDDEAVRVARRKLAAALY